MEIAAMAKTIGTGETAPRGQLSRSRRLVVVHHP